MAGKYSKFPDGVSEKGQWISVSLEFQVENYEIDWDEVDFATLAKQLGYIVGLSAAGSVLTENDKTTLNVKPAKILVRNLTAHEIDFMSDEDINKFLDGQQ